MPSTLEQHNDLDYTAIPRYWITGSQIELRESNAFYIGFKDVTSVTNIRTLIAAAIPKSGVNHKYPLIRSEQAVLLLSLAASFVIDYFVRNKLGGVSDMTPINATTS